MKVITKLIIFQIEINAESTNEQQNSTYPNPYVASTVNFHDIYTNTLDLISDDPSTYKNEALRISNILSQSEDSQALIAGQEISLPPSYIFNASESPQNVAIITPTYSTTTEESSVKVLPIKNDIQRGVLDLLFPAARVRTFKRVFDSVRRILSHTFRK